MSSVARWQTYHRQMDRLRERRDGFAVRRLDLVLVVTVHPGHDYGWLMRCRKVLDCTYRTEAGRERLVP